jgi:hypothetical protein
MAGWEIPKSLTSKWRNNDDPPRLNYFMLQEFFATDEKENTL